MVVTHLLHEHDADLVEKRVRGLQHVRPEL
jgi:hypothetical protein